MDYVIGAAILGTGIYVGLVIAANRDDERMDANDQDLSILYDNDAKLAEGVNEIDLALSQMSERLARWITDRENV